MPMKKSIPVARLVITAILALVVAFAVPQTLHRRDFDKAFFAYYRNPTAENETVLRREQAKNNRIWLLTNAAAALVLFIAINAVWLVAVRVNRYFTSKSHGPCNG
jgi:hypothetical protein